MFGLENLTQAAQARLGGLMDRVRGALPDIDLYEQGHGTATVEVSLGERRWSFDVTGRAAYVLADTRSLFQRITTTPSHATPISARPQIPANIHRCFDPTQARNAPAIAAQLVHSDPTVRGSGEEAFRRLVVHHPQPAAEAINQQRSALVAQGSTGQAARLDQTVRTLTQSLISPTSGASAHTPMTRSAIVSFAACITHPSLKSELVRIASISSPQIRGTQVAAPVIYTLDSFPSFVRDASVGACPSVFMARVSAERALEYGPFARTFIPTIEGVLKDSEIPTLLGTLPTMTYPTGTHTPIAHGPSRFSNMPSSTTVPLMTPIMTREGIVYIPSGERVAVSGKNDGRDMTGFISDTHTLPSSILPTPNDRRIPILEAGTFTSAANDNEAPQGENRFQRSDTSPTREIRFVDRGGTTPRPRGTTSHLSQVAAFATLFGEGTVDGSQSHGPISPAQVGFVVQEPGLSGARIPIAFHERFGGSTMTYVARRGEPHDGRGQRDGHSEGHRGSSDGNSSDQRGRHPREEEAPAEAAA